MDSTVVAVFDEPQRAEDAKKELLAGQISGDKDVSVVRQRSTVIKKGPVQKLKGLFGAMSPLRERAVLTVYANADSMRQVERIIRQHGPADVKLQLASSTPELTADAQR